MLDTVRIPTKWIAVLVKGRVKTSLLHLWSSLDEEAGDHHLVHQWRSTVDRRLVDSCGSYGFQWILVDFVAIYIKICPILLYYPLKFKSRSFRPCLTPLVEEQASSRYELVRHRERGTSIYLWEVYMWDTVLHCFNPGLAEQGWMQPCLVWGPISLKL